MLATGSLLRIVIGSPTLLLPMLADLFPSEEPSHSDDLSLIMVALDSLSHLEPPLLVGARACRMSSSHSAGSLNLSDHWLLLRGVAQIGSPTTLSMGNVGCCASNAYLGRSRRVPHDEDSRRAGCRKSARPVR